MWTGWRVPASRPSHLANSSREAVMYRPLRSTGMPSFAQRCATATGCPRNPAMAGHPVRVGELGSFTGTLARCLARFCETVCCFFGASLVGLLATFFFGMFLSMDHTMQNLRTSRDTYQKPNALDWLPDNCT